MLTAVPGSLKPRSAIRFVCRVCGREQEGVKGQSLCAGLIDATPCQKQWAKILRKRRFLKRQGDRQIARGYAPLFLD